MLPDMFNKWTRMDAICSIADKMAAPDRLPVRSQTASHAGRYRNASPIRRIVSGFCVGITRMAHWLLPSQA